MHGYFLSRNVDIGDTLTVEGEDYTVVQVLSETTLQVLHLTTGQSFSATLSNLDYSLSRRVLGRLLRFVPGTFSVTSPPPKRLWAEVTFLDNSETIEANFGTLVSLTREQLSARNTRSTTYREAVLGLMFAWANGPKISNLRLGASILLGLPVADVDGRILDIKEDYQVNPVTGESTLGRLLIEDIDSDTEAGTGLVRIYFYPPASLSDLAEFAGLEDNPETGSTYGVGDIVRRFDPLSKGLIITDYVDTPLWWRGLFLQGDLGAELRKYHTWSMVANVDVIDTMDLDLADEFAHAVDPAWTDVHVVAVKPLVDTITIEDDLFFEVQEWLVDNPFGGLEAAAVVDSPNNSGYALQYTNLGPLSTRVLFAGHDLQTPAGGAGPLIFTSTRC